MCVCVCGGGRLVDGVDGVKWRKNSSTNIETEHEKATKAQHSTTSTARERRELSFTSPMILSLQHPAILLSKIPRRSPPPPPLSVTARVSQDPATKINAAFCLLHASGFLSLNTPDVARFLAAISPHRGKCTTLLDPRSACVGLGADGQACNEELIFPPIQRAFCFKSLA
ncbi:hypothetical protein RRG08_028322 [Elysia crispata]|uniref:Uncharacterized protein n=1 Tax=Elysia crispata TaxID=231223 RepID=A0AAE1E5L6_9GAST|nr:hypothetical protein RRG08_028322 [Elysia crispata]